MLGTRSHLAAVDFLSFYRIGTSLIRPLFQASECEKGNQQQLKEENEK
jgi:hypothetical protein